MHSGCILAALHAFWVHSGRHAGCILAALHAQCAGQEAAGVVRRGRLPSRAEQRQEEGAVRGRGEWWRLVEGGRALVPLRTASGRKVVQAQLLGLALAPTSPIDATVEALMLGALHAAQRGARA